MTDAKAGCVKLKWSRFPGAEKYYLFRAAGNKKHFKRYRTFGSAKRKFTDSMLSMKKNYYYYIKVNLSKNDPYEYRSNMIVKSKVRGNYKKGTVYGPYLSAGELRLLRDKTACIVNKYQASELSAYDKICFAHDYIAAHTSYSTGGAQVSSALGPLKYGKRFYYASSNKKVTYLFKGFSKHSLKYIGIGFIRTIVTVIGLILFVFPGIWFYIRTTYVWNILIDNPEAKILSTFKESIKQTKKNRLLLFYVSYVGWEILGLISLGIINLLYVNPYIETGIVECYKEAIVKQEDE